VIVATDSKRILDVVLAAGGKAQMTSSEHPSGSDRVAEVASGLEADIIVNVQGDEPFITADVLKPLLDSFRDDAVQMASLMTPILDAEQLDDPGIVKVVTDAAGKALYFSRSLIPFDRDGSSGYNYMRHIGVYAWRRETLLRFVSLGMGKLERVEKLEQLRALENGIAIQMVETDYQGIGIDTPEDLARAERIIK
jgi:3-deoxy-manno-octulosonate cytidylyltransferase (CMP-KDO synthetase)